MFSSTTLTSVAAAMLLLTFWLLNISASGGIQIFASVAAGLCAWVTVRFVLSAVRADARELAEAEIRSFGRES